MSDTQVTQDVAPETAAVAAERARIAAELSAWAQGNGYGSYAATALRAVGLGEFLPRESAQVNVTVSGTVTVRTQADGTWTQADALRALESAVHGYGVHNGTVTVEASEVTADATE